MNNEYRISNILLTTEFCLLTTVFGLLTTVFLIKIEYKSKQVLFNIILNKKSHVISSEIPVKLGKLHFM
jgi:hypothetical protein